MRSKSNNAQGNEQVMFPRYRCSTMVMEYLLFLYWSLARVTQRDCLANHYDGSCHTSEDH